MLSSEIPRPIDRSSSPLAEEEPKLPSDTPWSTLPALELPGLTAEKVLPAPVEYRLRPNFIVNVPSISWCLKFCSVSPRSLGCRDARCAALAAADDDDEDNMREDLFKVDDRDLLNVADRESGGAEERMERVSLESREEAERAGGMVGVGLMRAVAAAAAAAVVEMERSLSSDWLVEEEEEA